MFDHVEKASAASRLRARLAVELSGVGYGKPGSIPEGMTFLNWCRDLAAKGLKVDARPFRLEDRPSMVPLYEAIPTTIEEARRKTLVLMKGAQLGATVWEMLADLYMAIKFEPRSSACSCPTRRLRRTRGDRPGIWGIMPL